MGACSSSPTGVKPSKLAPRWHGHGMIQMCKEWHGHEMGQAQDEHDIIYELGCSTIIFNALGTIAQHEMDPD